MLPLHRCAPALLIASLLGACASTSQPLHIQASADAVINRDAAGAPLSVVIRSYQLNDRQAFDRLAFDALAGARPEAALLDKTLVTQQEFVLTPGATVSIPLSLSPETRFLGIAGLFLKPDAQAWRALVDAQSIRRHGLRLVVRDCYLVVETPAPLPIPGQTAGRLPECGTAATRSAGLR